MDTGSLGNLELVLNISGHSEVRILINTLRDQTEDILVTEDMGEGSRNGRSSLDSGESKLTTVITLSNTKNTLKLIVCDSLLDFANVGVHVTNVVGISENESLIEIETTGDDILSIFNSQLLIFF